MMQKRMALLGIIVVCLWMPAYAEQPFVQSPNSVASGDRPLDSSTEIASDTATLEFVRMQEPELAKLLGFLKTKRNADYRDAIEEIRRVRERLESLRKRDQELHDVELAIWRNAAQLRLWAASVSASSKKLSDSDRAKLTELVTSENQLTLKRLNIDKARAEARLEQVKHQIAKREEQAENVIAKSIKIWEGRIERPTSKSKNKATGPVATPAVGQPSSTENR